MAAKDDFFLNFGSNAKTFSDQLIRELAPAKAEVAELGAMLKAVDALATRAAGKASNLGGGDPSGGGAPSLREFNQAQADLSEGLKDLSTELNKVLRDLRNNTSFVNRSGGVEGGGTGGQAGRTDRMTRGGRYVTAGTPGATVQGPSAARVKATAPPTITQVTKAQLDTAVFDRIVRSVDRVRDEVRRLGTKGIVTRSGGKASASEQAEIATAKKGKKTKVTPEAEVTLQEVADYDERLKRKLASLEVKTRSMVAAIKQGGGVVADGLEEAMELATAEIASVKAELAGREREISGVSKTEQKKRRKEEFAKGPDLDADEHDRRLRLRERLDLAMDPEALKGAVGRGANQLNQSDLREMAKQLTAMGFNTPSGKKRTNEQLIGDIGSSRQAMFQQYGADIPDELRTGRKLVKDKVSDSIRELLADVALTAADAASASGLTPTAAQENIKKAYQAQHLPLEGTRELTGRGGNGSLGGSAISVPRGMVKGGQYNDVFNFMESMELLNNNARKQATGLLTRQPGINLDAVKVNDEISGGGDEARRSRNAFFSVRRAILELDDLAGEYESLAQAFEGAGKFIERAEWRLDRLANNKKMTQEQLDKSKTDPENIRRALAIQTEMQDRMASSRFGMNQELFEDPEYQAGRRQREITRAQNELAAEERRLTRVANVSDASGNAIVGARLAPGTRSTIIRDIPGMNYDKFNNRFGFQDPERDPAELNKMNKAFRKNQRDLRIRPDVEAAVAAGERPQKDLDRLERRIENSATTFLNQMQEIFGISRPIYDVIAREAQNPENIKMEQDRQVASDKVRAQALNPESTGATDKELLARRVASVDQAQAAEVAAKKASAAGQKKLDAAIEKRQKTLTAEDRASVELTRAELELATAERRKASEGVRFGGSVEPNITEQRGNFRRASEALDAAPKRRAGTNREKLERELAEAADALELGYAAVNAHREAELENAKKLAAHGVAVDRELAVRRKLTQLLGGDAEDIEELRAAHETLKRAEYDAATETKRAAGNLREIALGQASQRIDSRQAKVREIMNAGGDNALLGDAQKKVDEARAEYARLSSLGSTDPAFGPLIDELREKSKAKPDENGNVAAAEPLTAGARKTTDSLSKLSREIERAEKVNRNLTDVRSKIKAGRAAGDDVSGLEAEREALKKSSDRRSRDKLAELRKARQLEIDAAGGGAGTGGGKGGSKGGSGGGGGGLGDSNNILRDILTAINNIHRQLQTGVKMSGGTRAPVVDKDGNVVQAKPRKVATSFAIASAEEQANAKGDERQQALAAAAQQRRLERFNRAPQANVASAQSQAIKEDERRKREAAISSRKAAKITEEEAHAQLRLAGALGLVDAATRKEIEELRRLNVAGADNAKIAYQQARAIAAIEQSLGQQNIPAVRRQDFGMALLDDAKAKKSDPDMDRKRYQEATTSARALFGDDLTRTMGKAGEEGRTALAQGLFGNNGFWSRIMGSTGAFIVRNFTAGFVFGMTAALQDIVMQGIITESTWIRVSDALEQTGRSAGSLRSDLQKISSDYGVALNDVYMTAAGLTGVFEDMGDLAAATRVVAQLQAISMGALNAQEAMGVLSSITGAYSDELREGADGLNQVADILTLVQNTIGTNVETTAEGVGALSGLSRQLKIPLEEMSVYVAQIAKLTNQTGAAAGEQFSRILASMQGGRGRAALSEALPNSGIEQLLGSGEYGQAIQLLMKEWDGLSDSQQRNLATTIAGQRQARAFAALMNDTGKTLDTTARAHNANGEAARRSEEIAATLNGRLVRLQANLQNLAQNLIRTGLLNFFGLLLVVLNKTLSAANRFFSALNDLTDSNPLLNTLKNWAAGMLGFIVTLKLGMMAIRGFRGSLAELRAGEGVVAGGVNAALGGRPGEAPQRRGIRQTAAASGGLMYGNLMARADDIEAKAAAKRATADAAESSSRRAATTTALNAQARATRLAAGASQKLGSGLGALANAGLGANLAMAGLAVGLALLTAELGRQKQLQEEVGELVKRYNDEGVRKTPEEESAEYIGPFSEISKRNAKETKGFWANVKFDLADTASQLETAFTDPSSLITGKGLRDTTKDQRKEAWKGQISSEMQDTLSNLREATSESINELDSGRAAVAEGGDLAGLLVQDPALKKQIEGAKKYTVQDVERNAAGVNSRITRERSAIMKQYEDGKIGDAEAASALGELEEIAKMANERIASQLMVARGMAESDILSSDMISQIDQLRPLFQDIQGSPVNLDSKMFGPGLEALLKDTGVAPDSKAGKIMARLAEGNLTRVESMREESELVKLEYEAAQAKYLAATSGETALEPEQVDELKNDMIAKMQLLAGMTEQMVQAFVQDSMSIAQAAAAAGNYGAAAQAIDNGLAAASAQRDRKNETPEVTARLDLMESQASQQGADYSAQEKNTRLQMAQARSQSSARDAQLEAQITQNTFKALQAAQRAAQAAGTQGPPAEAIRSAKIAWINAEMQLANTAQAANIAAMTLAAAGLWNGIASSQASEGIAMQQYQDAVTNFGAGSAEALNAQAGVVNAQKATQSTLDQVAQATNDAALAAIPQGNATAVASQGVRNAQAALAAAKKYGTNSTEYQGALAQLASAQQSAMQAQQAVTEAQIGVSIAIAEAAGNTVEAAALQLRAARVSFANARARAGGAMSSEALAARSQVISAQASLRDAKLQDDLDTIDFNVEMNRMTQSSAIRALKEILRTRDLTKQQRRDLMLQIKGMEEEMSGGQWNFGDIKMPQPYLMKRFITEMKDNNARRINDTIKEMGAGNVVKQSAASMNTLNDNRNVEINIHGGDKAEVRRIVEEVVGRPTKTRTVAPRRGRR